MSDSLITKKAIASGMKELTKKKNFDKITVSDITEICGLNRQTFYYHFQDKFDLVNWIYYNDAITVFISDNETTLDNWDSKILQMLTQMKSEDYFFINTLKASVEHEFREYLFKVTGEIFIDIISKNADHTKIGENELKFITDFYSYGIVGVIISWVQRGMKETPEYITAQLKTLAYGTAKFTSARYQQKNGQNQSEGPSL